MSKIPVFEILNLNHYSPSSYFEKKLKEQGIGQVPLAIKTENITREEFLKTLPEIINAVVSLKVNPKFPYPLYLVTGHIKHHDFFSVVAMVEHLPDHFQLKNKKIGKKETSILNKIQLKVEKIANMEIPKKLQDLSEAVHYQRKLYNLSKELHFYEQIKDQLMED